MEATIRSYREAQGAGASGAADSGTMVNQYYDLVTDFYEYGWGESFHFAARRRGETLRESLVRHEHFLALRLGLGPAMTALDVGCGVGGPARSIARFSGAEVLGLNNNRYQVERARGHTRRAGLEGRCRFLHGDFREIPLPDGGLDAAYAIESTCHAPDRRVVFSEVYRVLRPGALFGGYEWCMTPAYDPGDPAQREVRRGIEEGDGLPELTGAQAITDALEAVGFELLEARDLAGECDVETPWYRPLTAGDLSLSGLGRTWVGRRVTGAAVRLLERAGLAPQGAAEVHDLLIKAADSLVAGGQAGIFTPMLFFLGRKP